MADSLTDGSTDNARVRPEEGGYTVLARKYRPTRFKDLIGQEPIVQTLRNAFDTGRIAQAYILTGVRGVGKTTTARILARGLNFESTDGGGAPTVDLETMGVHCQAIMEGRHIDVIEMDAASHNGVDDIREIIDAARYAPVSARFKVYLLDEVHMLSKAAFNALLKTLEEPPQHVKFIFATTEIGKVPVTILSRCQRFDLRRIEMDAMVGHLEAVVTAEGASAEPAALHLIARSSEGSVRDALSLLDQAIAHTGADADRPVSAAALLRLFNLADQSATLDLFEAVMKGQIDTALGALAAAYARGTDPAGLIGDLAEMIHAATRLKVLPEVPSPSLTPDSLERLRPIAEALSMRVLSRAWQILLKGLDEITRAPKPLIAAEMILVRLAYAADLPTPDDVLRKLSSEITTAGVDAAAGNTGPATTRSSEKREPFHVPPKSNGDGGMLGQSGSLGLVPSPSPMGENPVPVETVAEAAPQPVKIRDLDALIGLAQTNGNVALPPLIRAYVRPVTFGDNAIEIGLADGAPRGFAGDLSAALQAWTGSRWMVSVRSDAQSQTLNEIAQERADAARLDAHQHPAVKAVVDAFPGAQITQVRQLGKQTEAEVEPKSGSVEASDLPIDSDEHDEETPPWTS
ncbi:MAG: DNA polymerase III subunit gamma/tau [Pseudomonadota bacterium]